jgi:hypothetical protein
MYQFDKSRLDLVREFKAKPFGEHSPDLQYLLHLLRKPTGRPFHLLVMTEPDARWTLALMEPGGRKLPRLTNTSFTSLDDAEWHVFRLRWQELAGEECPIE